MLYKTKGIVLRKTKFSDNSFILLTYTELFGLQSYIVQGINKKNTSIKPSYLSELSLLELNIYKQENKSIQRIKDARLHSNSPGLSNNPHKTEITFFISEILVQCIQEEEQNVELFSFIETTCNTLNDKNDSLAAFPIAFMVKLSEFLGLSLIYYLFHENDETQSIFSKEETKILRSLFEWDFVESIKINSQQKRVLLQKLIQYYQSHLHNLKSLKSLQIIQDMYE
jgi:DNA repair protein RecO (recombination protein O)